MMERLLALLLAGALVAPQVGQANESALNNDSARPVASKFPEKLTAPAHSLSRYDAMDELWIGIEGTRN
jgi:hypothetical protein